MPNEDYDIGKAFKAIEDELIASMIRNLKNHRAEEEKEGKEWTQWQVEQLRALEKYKKENAAKYNKRFKNINAQIGEMIRAARDAGNTEQEIAILNAIKNGFKAMKKTKKELTGEFFKLNDRKLDALIKATTHDMEKAETAVLRMANDKYRKVIFNAQVYANSGAGTYEKAVDMATRDMLNAGLNCIEYANGARHSLSDYADMAIRTANKRAYLQGEGEKRQEWGISTVIMNKRGNACPKCAPFAGKVMIDDVWSGGKKSDGSYPLLSSAIAKGLYHPRCKDSHTTYFPGISTADGSWTKEELAALGQEYEQEQKQQYAERQAERFSRLAEYSLDEDNKRKYAARAKEWKKKFVVGDNEARDRLGLITNNNKSNPRYYDYKNKGLSEVEKEIGKLDYEVAVAFDKNGKAVFCQLGIEDTIKFTKYQLSKMKGLDVTHNHPLSTPPSPEDLYLLVEHKANSFRTCGKNGTYVLEYNEQIERLPKFETFSYEYNKLLVELNPKIVKKYFNGSNEREVLIKLGDAIWEELYKKYGVKPRFERW